MKCFSLVLASVHIPTQACTSEVGKWLVKLKTGLKQKPNKRTTKNTQTFSKEHSKCLDHCYTALKDTV